MKKYTKIFVTLFAFLVLGFTNVNAKTVERFANSTYIIGDYEFTPYSALTTDRIMLAAKSIKGDKLTDMIIYYKRSDNKWINAITREELELNEEEIVIANIIDDFFEGDDLKEALCELQAKYEDLSNYTVSSRNNMITALELPENTSLEIKNKIDAIQNASKQLVIVAKWNVTETIGFAPHKKFTQKMEMMVGETKIDLSINNVEKITMAFNNQEAVELNANTDTVLWFDIERTSGDYTYYVETKDGQKYEAVLNWINNEKTIEFELTYPDPIYNEQRKTYYIGYKALDGENQLPLAKPNLKYAASKVKTGNWVLREITEDTDFNLWFNIDNETDSYEYIFIDSENQVYKGVINWINRTHVVEGELRDLKAEISFINLTVYTEVSKERLATSLELPENNYAEIIVKIEAIKDARNKLTLNAVWNVTDIIGFAPHKKFTQKMEMMVGETKIDLSINNVEKITMAFNNQEAVELNANTDTVLWFDIERTSGDYTYYVETKDGQKYEAVLNWINNEKAIDFELTYPDPIYNEQRETYYIGYKALDGENQLPLAKPNLKYAASKVKNGDWVLREITEDTDFNLWFNVDAEAGSYEYIFVDSENQVYKGVINFSNTYYEEEFEKLTNLKNEYLDLFIYTSESREDLEVALKLPETKYSEVVAKIKAIKDAAENLEKIPTATFELTGNYGIVPEENGEHTGTIRAEFQAIAKNGDVIDLSNSETGIVSIKSKIVSESEYKELVVNTDKTLWLDLEKVSEKIIYIIETKSGDFYYIELDPSELVKEATMVETSNSGFNEERGKFYYEYEIKFGDEVLKLNTSNIKYFAKKDPITNKWTRIVDITEEGHSLWMSSSTKNGTYKYLLVDIEGNVYISTINFTKEDVEAPELVSFTGEWDEEKIEVKITAKDNVYLSSVEVDHTFEENLPEFWIYNNINNPYGSNKDKQQFESYGVTVTLTKNELNEYEWTINITGSAYETINANDNNEIIFYIVIRDTVGNQLGSMSEPTELNMLKLTK